MSDQAEANEIFVTSRFFAVPREVVWKAWTEEERLKHWWGPKGFTLRFARLDLRPGGLFHYEIVSPQGQAMWGRFVFREITPPERLVFVTSFSDAEARITVHPLNPNWPREMLSTVIFEAQQGGTLLTIRWQPLQATEIERETFAKAAPSMQAGWGGTFDQLDAYLAG